jgi:hypothetical protein
LIFYWIPRPEFSIFDSGLKKSELANLIRKQIHCWPAASFNESKTMKRQMKAALIDPMNGFSNLDSQPLALDGSPLTSLPATPRVSTTPPRCQPDAVGPVGATDQLAKPDDCGNDFQSDPEGLKVCLLSEFQPHLPEYSQFAL